MPYRVFNLKEVAGYLHLSRADVEQLVRRQEIPCEHPGDRLIFRKKEIDAWASQRILGFSDQRLTDYHRVSSVQVQTRSQRQTIIRELLREQFIQPVLPSKTKPSILRDICEQAEQTGLVVYADDLLKSLEERERLCSTALPDGLALLHPRHHDPYMFAESFLLVGRALHPVPFGAPDGGLTDIFFLVCCQDDRLHLHVLARLCLMCKQTPVLRHIREAATAADIYQGLVRAEAEIIRNAGNR